MSQLVAGGNLSLISNANMAQINTTINHRPGQPENKLLLATVGFQNILIAKMERLSDILDTGHPGVETGLEDIAPDRFRNQ